jgi:hypothetical protein
MECSVCGTNDHTVKNVFGLGTNLYPLCDKCELIKYECIKCQKDISIRPGMFSINNNMLLQHCGCSIDK